MEQILKDLRVYWLANEVPNITDVNAKLLRDLIKIKKPKRMLEIGTANWFSWICFALELQKIGWNLTTIEFSSNSYWQALQNFENAKVLDIITAINWNALDEIPKLTWTFDFVFIDWMKRRTVDFLSLVWDKVEKDWVIIIDDVIKFRQKMVGLDDYLEKNNIKFNEIPVDIDDWIIMIIKE